MPIMRKLILLIFLISSHLNIKAQNNIGAKSNSVRKSLKASTEEMMPIQEEVKTISSVDGSNGPASATLSEAIPPQTSGIVPSEKSSTKSKIQFKEPAYFVILMDPKDQLGSLTLEELKNSGKYELVPLSKPFTHCLKAEKLESQLFKRAYGSQFIIFDQNDIQMFKTAYPFFDEIQKELDNTPNDTNDLKKKSNLKKENSKL
jgi:hypothetical protein